MGALPPQCRKQVLAKVGGVGVAAMAVYNTTFLLWTYDYCVRISPFEYFLFASTRHHSLSYVIIPQLVPVLVDHNLRRVV
jgi:hypothetical protein